MLAQERRAEDAAAAGHITHPPGPTGAPKHRSTRRGGRVVALGVLVTFVDSQKALLGLCVGLLGTVLALQVDALARFERRAEREDRIAALLRRVGDEARAIDRFESVADAVQAISGNRLFITAAHETLDDTASFFRRAGLGELRRKVNYRDLVSLVNGTHESIKAVSLSRSERDFCSGRGQEYWRANVEALRRKVEVHRVFVYAEPDKEFDRVSASKRWRASKVLASAKTGYRPALTNTC